MRKNISKFILVLLILILCFSFVGCKKGGAKEEATPTAITLPEGEYDKYLVLTTSLMRYAEDEKTLEVDVFTIGEDKEMTVQIDESGIIPRVGRSYRMYVNKETKKAVFNVPDTQSGTYAADFTPKPIAGRDGKYVYDGSGSKYEITKDTVFYYVEILDNGIHVSKKDTLTGFAKWNGNCKGDDEEKTHVHTNGCMIYNAYLHYRSSFAKDSTLDWIMISVDGQSLFKNIGNLSDSSLAVLPGQNPDQDDIVLTTSEPYMSESGLKVGVQDLTGEKYTINLSQDSITPTGGRIYRIVNKDGVYTLKAASEDGDGYDFRNGAITDKSDKTVTINTDKEINLKDETQIVEGKRLWTGWLRIGNVDGSQLGIGKSTNSCKEQGDHEHTRKCFFYNTVYKTDGVNNLTWIMNTPNGESIYDNIGKEDSIPYGSGSPAKVVIVQSISGNMVTVMDMNGETYTLPIDASGLDVKTGKIYHMEQVGGKGVFSVCERSYKEPYYDLIANPLMKIDGKTLTFNMGENEKEAYITSSTKIWYATYTDGRLVLKDAGKMSIANRSNGCLEKGSHTHDSGCYLTNAIFACDGEANIKWVVVTETGNSLFGGIAKDDKTAESGDEAKVFWTTSYPILEGGKVSIKGITMDGTEHTYVVDESGIMPVKGSIYHIASVSNGKVKLTMPNMTMSQEGYDFVRRPIVKYANATSAEKAQGVTGHITIPSGLKYSITKDTKIYNLEMIGGIPCLTNTKNINVSKLSDADKCIVTKEHKHGAENDCYNWNVYYSLAGDDSVKWIITAPSDVSIFRRPGMDAFQSFDSESPSNVALISKTYPSWDASGKRIDVAEYVDMTGATKTMEISRGSVIPLKGKYYHVKATDGKAVFSIITKNEAPSKLEKDGYAMCRHQLIDFDKTSGYGLTRASQMFRVTKDSKLFNGDYTEGQLTVKPTDELTLSVMTKDCTGNNHNHTADCFFWGLAFATDADGNLKWATTKETGNNSSIWGSVAETEDKPVDEIGLLITTGKFYMKDGKNVIDAEDVSGKKYTALELTSDSIIPQPGFGYWTTIDGNKVTFKEGATGAYRDKAISYSKGLLDANSFDYNVPATTIIRYVSLNNKKLSLTTGSGIPAAVGGSNLWVGVKDKKTMDTTFVVVEKDGNGIYSYIGVPCTHDIREVVDKEADNKNTGLKHTYCAKCGYTWPQEVIPVGEVIETADGARVLWTTSYPILEGGKVTIKGITMDGTQRTYEVDESGIMPMKGSIYHVESVNSGKAKLVMPNMNASESGYDFTRRPIVKYQDATAADKANGITGYITIPNGTKYNITSDTKVYNLEQIGGIMCLTDTQNINVSKLGDASKCTVKNPHTHGAENDCYTWNAYYSIGEDDNLKWVMTAPSDVSIFRKVGLDAFQSYDSENPSNVALISKTYPTWDAAGTRTDMAEYVDMAGSTKKLEIGDGSLIPLIGKYYNVKEASGKAVFTIIDKDNAPSKLVKDGYAMCRHQLIDFDKQSGYGLTRSSQMFRVTKDSKLFSGDYTDGQLTVKPTDQLTISEMTTDCTGTDHNHTPDCFFWGLAFATDADGNLKWATTKETGNNSSIWGSLADTDDKSVDVTGLLITTSKIYQKDGKNVIDAEDVTGKKYTALEISSDSIIPQFGFGYWTTIDGNKATFKSSATGAYRDKAISYSEGLLDANSFDYQLSATTIVRYVSLKNKQLTLTTGSGIPAAVGGSNLWVGVKDNVKLDAKFVVVEKDGNGIYSYIGVACSHDKNEVIDKEAGCTTTGTKHYYCSKCGYTWPQETVAATGHTWKWVTDQEPTCNETGKKHEECEKCGAKQSENTEIPKLEHVFTNYVSNNDATCTEDGTKTAQCDHGCGATDTIADPGSALGHDYVATTEDGVTTYTCSRCGDTYSMAAADRFALTLSHAYPEWSGGVKTNKIKILTMKGEEKIVTIDTNNQNTPIKGKLYDVAINDSNVATFTELAVNGADAKLSVQVKDFTAYSSGTSVTAGDTIQLAAGAYSNAVSVDANNRMTITTTNPTSGKCLYTLDNDGKLAWLLVSADDISVGVYNAAAGEKDMEPVERSGYALVKNMTISETGDSYQVTYYDFAMEGVEETKTLSGTFYPKNNYAYAYVVNDDGTVTFSQMAGSDSLQRDQVKVPYAEGILTGSNSKKINYNISVDTKIFYAKATAGTSTVPGTLEYDGEYTDGLVANTSKYTYWVMRDENNYAKWIVLNTANTSSYYCFGDTGYGAHNATLLPGKIALVDTNVWLDDDGSYKVQITTMAGEKKTVTVDTESADGVVPIRGSLYKIEEGANGTTFAWTSLMNYKDFDPQGTGTDEVRGQVKSVDTAASKLVVWDKDKANVELPLASDVSIVIANRESGTVAIAEDTLTLADVTFPGASNANYNAYFGYDMTGKVSWVLLSSGTSSIYSIGDPKTEPKLPTGYIITTKKIQQQGDKWILSFQDISGAVWTDVTLDREYTGTYLKTYYGGLFKFSYNSETSEASLSKTGVSLGKMQSFTDTQFVVKDGSGDHTINYTGDTPILAVRKDGAQTSATYGCINVTGTNLTVQAGTYNTWYLADGDNCKWVVCGTTTGSIYNYANSDPMPN